MKKLSIFCLTIIIVATSCKKDSTVSCSLNTTNVAGTYKMTSYLYKADANTPEVDKFPSLPSCVKDDLYIFNPDGTYDLTEGATSCTPTNASSGNWSLFGTTMYLDGGAGEVLYFDCRSLKVKTNDVQTGEVNTITFVKQ